MAGQAEDRGLSVILAPAKLTLSLRVTGVRADGYHLLDAEMVSLDLADELTFSDGTGRGIDDLEAPAVIEGQLVGQVEAHHLGVEQVVTVGADAGHPQRERELGRREDDAQSAVFCLPSHTLTARSTAV